MSIGRALQVIMKEKKISAVHLATDLGFSRQTIYEQVGDKSNPTWSTVKTYADALGVTVSYIEETEKRISKMENNK